MESLKNKTLVLFDVDGTLTKSRLNITEDMEQILIELRNKVTVGLVGGSNLAKIAEQMQCPPASGSGDQQQAITEVINKYDYVFSENGLIAYQHGKLIGTKSILDEIGEKNIQRFINFCLCYLSKLELPCKRGTFVEFRTGMINLSPVGRSCSQEERLEFYAYDQEHKIREKMVQALNAEFGPDFGLAFALGGQISIDCFPLGWDKTFCLQFVEGQYERIYFFGDKTFPGGNDYEIFEDPRTIGHTVTDYMHTKQLIRELFLK